MLRCEGREKLRTWNGLARSSTSIPSSSRAWAFTTSSLVKATATCKDRAMCSGIQYLQAFADIALKSPICQLHLILQTLSWLPSKLATITLLDCDCRHFWTEKLAFRIADRHKHWISHFARTKLNLPKFKALYYLESQKILKPHAGMTWANLCKFDVTINDCHIYIRLTNDSYCR